MKGRKPLPVELIDNNTRHLTEEEIRHRKANTPKGCSAGLRPPKQLSDFAKKEWRRMIKLYSELDTNILNDLDKTALTMYCEAVSVYQAAQKEWIEKQKVLGINSRGQITLNPYIKAMNEQTKIITSLSEQLCLTPVGRARMGMIKENEPKNPLKDFMTEFRDEDE